MRSLRGWVLGLVVLAGMLFAAAEAVAACPFRYQNGDLQFYCTSGGEWLPARVTGDMVEIQSDGQWWPMTGYSADDISCAGSSSSRGTSFRQGTNRTQARQFVDDSGMSYRDWREALENYSPEDRLGLFKALSTSQRLVGSSSDVAPAKVPDWRTVWGLSATYREDDFDVAGGGPLAAKTRTRSQTVSLTAVHDRLVLLTALTYDRIDPDAAFGDTAYDRLGLRVTPVYALLEQAPDGFDLDLIGSLGFSHSWYEDDMGTNDPSHVLAAGGLGLGRVFSFGALRLSYLYGVSKNISGDNEVTGKTTISMHSAGVTYTVPIAKRWMFSTGLDWVHTCDIPSVYDADEYSGQAGVSYLGERWGISVSTQRSIRNANQRQWSLTGRVTYDW